MNKSTLLELIQTEHHRFKSVLAELSEAEMTTPGVINEWSVNDILVHIIVHKQRMISWISKKLGGIDLNMPQPYNMPQVDLATVNEQIHLEGRDKPLTAVLAELDKVHEQAVALVQNAPEADLMNPKRYQLDTGEALWVAVAANTYEHYQEHAHDIRIWRQKIEHQ